MDSKFVALFMPVFEDTKGNKLALFDQLEILLFW